MTAPTNPSVSAYQAIAADWNRITTDLKDQKYNDLGKAFSALMKDYSRQNHHHNHSKAFGDHQDRDKASSASNTQVCQGGNQNGGKQTYSQSQRQAESSFSGLPKGGVL